MTRGRFTFWWAVASVAGMALGAFGPWATALGASVSGIDGSNDGWIVLGAAVVALVALLSFAREPGGGKILLCVLAAIAGAATTIYDRHNISSAINQGGDLARALAHVGWGLNLAMIASVSLGIASLVLVQVSATPEAAQQPVAPIGHPDVPARRECPFCKELMRRDASTCPHCRKESPAWTFNAGVWWLQRPDGQWLEHDEESGGWRLYKL